MLRGLRPVESATFRPQGNGEIAIERRGGCWCFLFFRSNLEKIQVLTVLVLASEKQKTPTAAVTPQVLMRRTARHESQSHRRKSDARINEDAGSPTPRGSSTFQLDVTRYEARSAGTSERFASSCCGRAGRPPNKALHRTRRVRWLGRYRGPGTAMTARRQGRCISLPPVLPSVAAAALPLWCWRGWRRAGERQVR